MNLLKTKTVSSLVKVFPDGDPGAAYAAGSALRGEVFSFQVAYRAESLVKRLHIQADAGALTPSLRLYQVGLVPAHMTGYGDGDDFVLRTAPGLYPDPLYPISAGDELYAYPHQWQSILCSVEIPADAEPGDYPVHLSLDGFDDSTFGGQKEWRAEASFHLTVLPPVLPRQEILHTEWFAADCITTWYDLQPMSERWWTLIEAYIANAAHHGVNMILTPLFTPPLDTQIGGERPTIQLAGIRKTGSRYHFSFDQVGRWLDICLRHGIDHFEIPHLFTQWGAKCAPKIMADADGRQVMLFGWHTAADSEEYLSFLDQFLPALLDYMTARIPHEHIYFHISDEPGEDSMAHYCRLCRHVRALIGDCPMMDAMSSLKLYRASSLTFPVSATDEIQDFIDDHVENLWAYYACTQYKRHLSNRFLNFPASRTRIIGMQLYRNRIRGFLHWGYNHWYSGLSIKRINPYQVTDADACFPAGDPFLVYPGDDGPLNSLRIELIRQAFQDHRALCLLEQMTSREEAVRILEQGIAPITFTDYPCGAQWMLLARERINQAIAAAYAAVI